MVTKILGRPPTERIRYLLMLVTVVDFALACMSAICLTDWRNADPHAVMLWFAVVLTLPLQCLGFWWVLRGQFQGRRELDVTRSLVTDILKSGDLQIAFQPVRSVRSGQIVGVEALSRFPQTPSRPPHVWFAQAESVGLGVDLQLLALRLTLDQVRWLDATLTVALNLSPEAILDSRSTGLLLGSAVDPSRLVVEITEHTAVGDYGPLRRVLAELRGHGIKLAIDDAGAGFASFSHIVALAPDVIKIDRTIISGIDTHPAQRALVRSMVSFAADCSAQTVAEGIETTQELSCVSELGVDLIQGYLVGRPTTDAREWRSWNGSPLHVLAFLHSVTTSEAA